jgi:large subunit ribosomal protein L47
VKSSGDLHKLWYVLLKERNMLLTMQNAYRLRHWELPNPERVGSITTIAINPQIFPIHQLDRVQESMDNLEAIVHERNDAFLRLETGDGAGPPKRQITSFAGFTYS